MVNPQLTRARAARAQRFQQIAIQLHDVQLARDLQQRTGQSA